MPMEAVPVMLVMLSTIWPQSGLILIDELILIGIDRGLGVGLVLVKSMRAAGLGAMRAIGVTEATVGQMGQRIGRRL